MQWPMGEAAQDMEMMTVEDLAKVMHIPRKTLYDCIHRGEIPGVRRLGRRFRIHRETVLAWVKSGKGDE